MQLVLILTVEKGAEDSIGQSTTRPGFRGDEHFPFLFLFFTT